MMKRDGRKMCRLIILVKIPLGNGAKSAPAQRELRAGAFV